MKVERKDGRKEGWWGLVLFLILIFSAKNSNALDFVDMSPPTRGELKSVAVDGEGNFCIASTEHSPDFKDIWAEVRCLYGNEWVQLGGKIREDSYFSIPFCGDGWEDFSFNR